jgi:hypothetical protein
MGAVYLAEHRHMQRQVALKVISPDLVGNAAAVQRFRQEVTAAARLGPHPNVVTVFDADHVGDVHFLVMEYLEGQNLADLLRQTGTLPIPQACDYVRQAALGLQHAALQGMVHRDVKPHNLLLTDQGEVKVLDFGLARLARGPENAPGQLTQSGVLMGTADYMAPEQANDSRSVDSRADVYSLGCTFYQLLAGRVPFPGGGPVDKIIKHAVEAPTPLAELRPEVSTGVVQLVQKMMGKAPESRPQTPGEVAAALAPGAGPAPTLPAQPAPDAAPSSSATLPVASLAAKAVAAKAGRAKREFSRFGLFTTTMFVCLVGAVASLVPTVVYEDPFWGVSGFSSPVGLAGAWVLSIDPGSPVASAGLRTGDQIVTINEKPVEFANLRQLLAGIKPGEVVTLGVKRNNGDARLTGKGEERVLIGVLLLGWQILTATVFLALLLILVATGTSKIPSLWQAILITAGALLVLATAVIRVGDGIPKWAVVWQSKSIPAVFVNPPLEVWVRLAISVPALALTFLGAFAVRRAREHKAEELTPS